MRIIDRLYQYLEFHAISAYAVEHRCQLSNGYLGKQFRGKGTMGSEVLLKIQEQFNDLNIHWLLTGKGRMIRQILPYSAEEEPDVAMVLLLQEQIALLQKTLADKNELILLLKKKRPLKRSALTI
jgi:hypothetical protein